jgi:predicted RNA-binding Zn-ribbon protein involved in translation (DUF1610 family)
VNSDRAELLAALDAEAFAGSRRPDTPELQAYRRRVLCEATAADRCVCPICGKAVLMRRSTRTVGRHYRGMRRCSGFGMSVDVRLIPVPTYKEI